MLLIFKFYISILFFKDTDYEYVHLSYLQFSLILFFSFFRALLLLFSILYSMSVTVFSLTLQFLLHSAFSRAFISVVFFYPHLSWVVPTHFSFSFGSPYPCSLSLNSSVPAMSSYFIQLLHWVIFSFLIHWQYVLT